MCAINTEGFGLYTSTLNYPSFPESLSQNNNYDALSGKISAPEYRGCKTLHLQKRHSKLLHLNLPTYMHALELRHERKLYVA